MVGGWRVLGVDWWVGGWWGVVGHGGGVGGWVDFGGVGGGLDEVGGEGWGWWY